jgi:hypothetical protein
LCQDLAFEKSVGNSATAIMSASGACSSAARKAARSGSARRPSIALSASATRTRADRDLLTADLKAAKVGRRFYEVTGIGPTLGGHNGSGDLCYTDSKIKICVPVAGSDGRAETVAVFRIRR